MPGNAAVKVIDVWKSFRGHPALKGVTLEVPSGSLFYLLGPNGSGKTTMIRVALGLYRPDHGHVETLSTVPGGSGWEEVKRVIGYVPENADVYERLTGREILEFYARLYDPDGWRGTAEYGARISGLGEDLERRAGEYSRGMRRRLLLAVALMRRPRLLVLDEPFSGVDVISAYRMKREILRLVREEGVTVLATSHNILEAERFATRIAFIYKGRIVYEGTVEGALERYGAEGLEEAFTRAVGEA
ncbi:MAG: ABC transporter ATP-binding protein [Desulfurococcales archaeon]|nr:ABC transporter ATP-binding protein [Desulfurococcales archaeon]